MAVGVFMLLALGSFAIHTILFLWSHIHFMDGQNYVLYERFWPFKWFKKTLALPSFGRTFTMPLFSRIKTDQKGKLVQFSQREVRDLVEFANVFKNNSAIVTFSFYLVYNIVDIDKFINANDLHTNCDHSVFTTDFKTSLKKEFKNQKLVELKTDRFQQWADKVKNEFGFDKYGIQCLEITLKDADVKIPLNANLNCVKEMKKLLGLN